MSKRRSIHAVAEHGTRTWFVELQGDDDDFGHAVGSVYARDSDGPDNGVPAQVLATNDLLTALHVDAHGERWVASATGHVATTARVSWATATRASYTSKEPGTPWTATALPPVRATGLPPNITTLWSTATPDGTAVFAGAVGGHIYRSNDMHWLCVHDGRGAGDAGIRAFAASAGAVFAVGDGVILHSADGVQWHAVPVDVGVDGGEMYTGVVSFDDVSVLVCASNGRVLQVSATGVVDGTRASMPLIASVRLGARVLFATGDGVAELLDGEVRMIKSTFQTATAWPGASRAFFIEPEQPVPAFIEHHPAHPTRPWFRRKH